MSIRAHEHTKPRIRAEPRKPASEKADVMQGVKERQRSYFYDHAVTRLASADLKAETDGSRVDVCVVGAGMP